MICVCFCDLILFKDNQSKETESVESHCTMDTWLILYCIWLYPTTEHDHSFFWLISELAPRRHLSDHRCILARSRVAIVNLLATLWGWGCSLGIANDATAVWPGVKGLREQCSRYIKIMFSALALGGRSWLWPGFNCAAWPTHGSCRTAKRAPEQDRARGQQWGWTIRAQSEGGEGGRGHFIQFEFHLIFLWRLFCSLQPAASPASGRVLNRNRPWFFVWLARRPDVPPPVSRSSIEQTLLKSADDEDVEKWLMRRHPAATLCVRAHRRL